MSFLLCPFVGGKPFLLPGGWEKNWGPFVYTDPGYGKLANWCSHQEVTSSS